METKKSEKWPKISISPDDLFSRKKTTAFFRRKKKLNFYAVHRITYTVCPSDFDSENRLFILRVPACKIVISEEFYVKYPYTLKVIQKGILVNRKDSKYGFKETHTLA